LPTGFGNGFAAGSTAISLRGLGATSTLVLLNGRRMASFGRADDGQKTFTDLSTIPMELVERIEILKDGSSAVYGADAIAGVVNIILKQNYQGIVATASAGTSKYHDNNQTKAALTAGFGDYDTDRYNVMANFEVYNPMRFITKIVQVVTGSAQVTCALGVIRWQRSLHPAIFPVTTLLRPARQVLSVIRNTELCFSAGLRHVVDNNKSGSERWLLVVSGSVPFHAAANRRREYRQPWHLQNQ
jgi:outer membrane receptor protein involved in Fe transport